MANAPVAADPNAPRTRKSRGPRKPKTAKPVFLVMSIVDDNGNPLMVTGADGTPRPLTRNNVKLVGVKVNADQVLDIVEGNPSLFYIRTFLDTPKKEGPSVA